MVRIIQLNWIDKEVNKSIMSKPYNPRSAREFLKDKMKIVNLTLYRGHISNAMPEYDEIKNSLLISAWRIYQKDNTKGDAYYYRCLGNFLKDIKKGFHNQKIVEQNKVFFGNDEDDFDPIDIEDVNAQSEDTIHSRVIIEKIETHLSSEAQKLLMNVYTFQNKRRAQHKRRVKVNTENLLAKVKYSMDYTDECLDQAIAEIHTAVRKINAGIEAPRLPGSIHRPLTELIKAEVG